MNKKLIKVIIYVFLFIPTFILTSELSLALVTEIAGFNIRVKRNKNGVIHKKTFDLITGSQRFIFSQDLKKRYINRHGLIRTIHQSDKNKTKEIRGIVILGNSVSVGYPLTEQGNFENTFVNILEKELRKKYNSIDIVNLSNHGLNSWQENIQLVRYLNSHKRFADLPDFEITASLGGIQDFWGFINLISNKEFGKNDFYKANGLMSLKYENEENFFIEVDRASKGNIISSLNLLKKSIITFLNHNSYTLAYIKAFEEKALSVLNKKINNEIKPTNSYQTLEEIVLNKLEISLKDYYQRRTIVIESVLRNLQSINRLNKDGNFLFVYLPTRFGFSKNQPNVSNRFKYNSLTVLDLNILERDYRESLIKAISKFRSIKFYNLANNGSHEWFYDESHYSTKGQKEIANLLYPLFIKEIVNLRIEN